MIVDLTMFFIISTSNFNTLLSSLDISLSAESDMYYASYLLTNAFAYAIIIIFFVLVYKCFNRLMRKTGSLLG